MHLTKQQYKTGYLIYEEGRQDDRTRLLVLDLAVTASGSVVMVGPVLSGIPAVSFFCGKNLNLTTSVMMLVIMLVLLAETPEHLLEMLDCAPAPDSTVADHGTSAIEEESATFIPDLLRMDSTALLTVTQVCSEMMTDARAFIGITPEAAAFDDPKPSLAFSIVGSPPGRGVMHTFMEVAKSGMDATEAEALYAHRNRAARGEVKSEIQKLICST